MVSPISLISIKLRRIYPLIKLDTDAHLDSLGFFKDGSSVLDIGCGLGYIAEYILKNRLNVTYLGIDIDSNRIRHCQNRFRQPNFKFKKLNILSATYNPLGSMDARHFKINLPNNSVDSVICHSLFTHLDTEEVALVYMKEIWRVLKPQGILWTTWFVSPPNELVGGGTMRTVYRKEFVADLLSDYEIIEAQGGESVGYHDQWEVAAVKG